MRNDFVHSHTVRLTDIAMALCKSIAILLQFVTFAHAQTEGQIKLQGGTSLDSGNVLIYHDGRWGKICDDGWNLEAAQVICRSLGFQRALTESRESYFGEPENEFWLDDVRCYGAEARIEDCDTPNWGSHNCRTEEAAGVFCSPFMAEVRGPATVTMKKNTTSTPATTTTTARPRNKKNGKKRRRNRNRNRNRNEDRNRNAAKIEEEIEEVEELLGMSQGDSPPMDHHPPYEIRVVGGRYDLEGRVEVNLGNGWGVICSDDWGLHETMIACKQAGLGYGKIPTQLDNFGGGQMDKLLGGISCEGDEGTLSECYHGSIGDVICSKPSMVAGVICSRGLPDLVPNATLLQESSYLQDRPMYYLQCAMEENCAAPSAFTVREKYRDWHLHRRRLLRFSSSTWNFGTADFRPFISKNDWEWHLCHMHYHSMSVFAHYDILDLHHNRVAEGHKASFCLEDVQCIPDKEKKYACKGFGDQGISLGCADDYLHDIDCQWIDITDVTAGNYIFKVHINPEEKVAELDFSNNAVTCDLEYTGYDVTVSNCQLGRG